MAKNKRYYKSGSEEGMIKSDKTSFANMPQEVIFKPYGTPTFGTPDGIDDTISGVDRQITDDSDEMKKNTYGGKY